ncbi:hypothetical protein FB45DRAFT_132702 [Roridomyces roridus]|uniref:MYND-type domain-containing protein n=1 Tax=Roridomyces roridus TaxID=1738132 RepID=A0AAD7BH17_9AGAR|nr:hypothetical protein FB45DRAFT_132702 [Roridomyces roridus]
MTDPAQCAAPDCEKQVDLLICSRCKNTTYCGSGCQEKDWPVHQKTCIPGGGTGTGGDKPKPKSKQKPNVNLPSYGWYDQSSSLVVSGLAAPAPVGRDPGPGRISRSRSKPGRFETERTVSPVDAGQEQPVDLPVAGESFPGAS